MQFVIIINLILSSRLIGLAMIAGGYLFLLFMPGRDVNNYLLISNLFIILFSTIFCFSNKNEPFSLFKIVLLFYAIFFGLAPLLEYKLSVIYAGGVGVFKDLDYLLANAVIAASLGLYVFCYFLVRRLKLVPHSLFIRMFVVDISNYKRTPRFHFSLLILSFFSLVLILLFYSFDINLLLLRGGDFDVYRATENTTISLIVMYFLRPLVFNAFLVYLFIRKKVDSFAILFFCLAILGASPTAMARFATSTLYMSIILLYIWKAKAKGFYLNNMILFGFWFVFPFLDLFRRFSGWENFKFNFGLDFFAAGHFDAYQELVRVISYDLITYGYQLLGVLLFFVPRLCWPNKPVGSGSFLADYIGLPFKNISMPLLGEGYINFGWLGLFVFVFILAIGTAKLDKHFWTSSNKYSSSLLPLVYMQLIGLVFFIMRGDLLSSFSYTCGIIFSLSVIAYYIRFFSFNRVLKR